MSLGKWDIESIREGIKVRLNVPNAVYKHFTDSQIEALVEDACEAVTPYLGLTDYVNKSVSGGYCDMSEEDPVAVIDVYKAVGRHSGVTGGESPFDLMMYNMGVGYGGYGRDLQTYANLVSLSSQLGGVDHLSPKLIGDRLFVGDTDFSGNVTVEYVPRLTDLSQIKSPKYRVWVREYALALCKEAVGKLIGRVSMDGIPIKFNYGNYITEANEAKEALITRMIENGNGRFFIRTNS